MVAKEKQADPWGLKVSRGWLTIAAVMVAHLGLFWLARVPPLPLLVSATGLSALIFLLLRNESGAFSSRLNKKDDEPLAGLNNEIANSVLARFPDPVIILDQNGRIVLSNEDIHPLIAKAAPGRMLSAVMRAPALLDAIGRILDGGEAEAVEFTTPGFVDSHSHAHCVPMQITGEDGDMLYVLVVLHDLTGARRVDQMRVDFIANVSHELKTPLASLVGFVETLRGPAKDDEAAREKFLSIMHNQSTRMGRLVDDLLSLSRIELDEHVPPTDPISLDDVVDEVITLIQPVAEERGVKIEFHVAEGLPIILASRDQLFQVFQNLIDNAVKYGGKDNLVNVTISLQRKFHDESNEETIRVDVTDHGPGIAREHIPRLTERFYRVDVGKSRTSGGTGLGLAIVKHIVSRHRGEFSIQSELGKGSTFSVVLPVATNVDAE